MKQKRLKKCLAAILASSLLFSFAGCDKKEEVASGSPVKTSGEKIYPVECEDSVSVWMALNAQLSTQVTNFGETELAKALEERTGIKVEYIHPAQGQGSEQFNLMIASGELPDVIQWNWAGYGAQTAIDSKYILSLNDVFDKWAPNVKALLEKNQDIDKMVKTDAGTYYVFPSLRGSKIDCVYTGLIIRQDYLDKLNMDVPETMDEWEAVLKGFKNEIGVSIPFSCMNSYLADLFAGAWGVKSGFYIDDNGKVQYGPSQDAYFDYLTKMNQWYEEGLLDSNIAGVDSNTITSNMLSDKLGATVGTAAGSVGKWTLAMKDRNADFKLVGAPSPVLKKGERPQFAIRDWDYLTSSSFAITGQCKNPELAARFLDYGYSEEGSMLYNFGLEGVTYEMKDGEPAFTELIMNNPDGKDISTALSPYTMSSYSGPFMQDPRVVEIMQSVPKQSREAVLTWADTDMEKHQIPLVSMTYDESREYANAMSEVSTYVNEMTMKFIVGIEPLENWSVYKERLGKFGIDRAIEIYQGAVDRYNKR